MAQNAAGVTTKVRYTGTIFNFSKRHISNLKPHRQRAAPRSPIGVNYAEGKASGRDCRGIFPQTIFPT